MYLFLLGYSMEGLIFNLTPSPSIIRIQGMIPSSHYTLQNRNVMTSRSISSGIFFVHFARKAFTENY